MDSMRILETMQRMLARMEEQDICPALCREAHEALESVNSPDLTPDAYLWGGCLWRVDEMTRGRPGAVELYRRDKLIELEAKHG